MTKLVKHSGVQAFEDLNVEKKLCRDELKTQSIASLKASDSSLNQALKPIRKANMPDEMGLESPNQNLNLTSQFTTNGSLPPCALFVSVEDRHCDSKDNKKCLSDNTVTPERIETSLMNSKQTHSITSYDFDSIPLFSQKYFSSFTPSHTNSTTVSKGKLMI